MAVSSISRISVIIPCCNEEENVEPLYLRLKENLDALTAGYEIIFVDDASTDTTFEALSKLSRLDPCVKTVRLKENRGQNNAYREGFNYATGNVIIAMDADLQNDPSDIGKFLAKIGEGFDFVSGVRKGRRDGDLRKAISYISNRLIGLKTGKPLDYGCGFCASTTKLASLTRYFPEEKSLKPLLACLADSIAQVEVPCLPRRSGRSKYGFLKIAKAGIDFFFNFQASKIRRKKTEICDDKMPKN